MSYDREFDGGGRGRRPVVLHLTQPVDGGVATVVADLVRAQRDAGLRVHVGCPPGGTLPETVQEAGARAHPWPASRQPGPQLYAEVRRAARLVERVRPDLLHLHSAKAGLAGRLAVRGRVPTLFQPHAWSFEAAHGLTRTLALNWERYATRLTSRLLCVSEAERRRGERAGLDARWSVVGNGVDLTRYPPPAADTRQAARAALPALAQLPGSDPLVVCVGRLCEQKGQDILLRAWPTVTARHRDARLVLVGEGPARAALRAQAPDSVLFAGATDQVRRWYEAADLVVQPSRWEGMALAPLEAMACGRPVLLTEVDGARECLPPAQHARQLVPIEDPFALATALGELLADPLGLGSAGRQARSHVTTTHDVRQTAAAVLDLYRESLCRPHRDPRERIAR